MSDQQKKREQLKQQVLDQIQTQQEAIEALSDEELEEVAGGLGYLTVPLMRPNFNTGVVGPNFNTGMVRPNLNTGAVHNGNPGIGLMTTQTEK